MSLITIICLLCLGAILIVCLTGAPYLPSKKRDVKRAFSELYPLGKKDLLVDLGAGDGKILGLAAETGASAVGIEINPLLVLWGKLRNFKNPAIKMRCGNLFTYKFPKETTVVYLFGDARDMKRMVAVIEREAKRLGRPLFLISYGFRVRGIKPEKKVGPHFLYKIG